MFTVLPWFSILLLRSRTAQSSPHFFTLRLALQSRIHCQKPDTHWIASLFVAISMYRMVASSTGGIFRYPVFFRSCFLIMRICVACYCCKFAWVMRVAERWGLWSRMKKKVEKKWWLCGGWRRMESGSEKGERERLNVDSDDYGWKLVETGRVKVCVYGSGTWGWWTEKSWRMMNGGSKNGEDWWMEAKIFWSAL